MDSFEKKQTRKRFIGLGITAAAALSILRFFIPEKKKQIKTVKMLTQDGKLVEVDAALLPTRKGEKISEAKLKVWVSRKS